MRAKTHAALGAAVYCGTVLLGLVQMDHILTLDGILSAIAGSALPDVDVNFGDHRGVTQSLIAAGGVTLILLVAALFIPFLIPVLVGLECGYLSHILADIFTDSGVQLL